MTTPGPVGRTEFHSELAMARDASEAAAFSYFYQATQKEGIPVQPKYTWDQFQNGIAPFNSLPLEIIDGFVAATNLIPNLNRDTCAENNISGVPMLEALDGGFIKALHIARQTSAVRIIGPHPTLATPFLFARTVAAAYEHEFGVDVRDDIYIVTGAYPTTMEYVLESRQEEHVVSPVVIGRSLGNLALTAPRTANTQTEEHAVQDWMNMVRSTFKINNRQLASTPGKILIILPSGRRGEKSKAKVPPFHHKEYLPDSNLDYITDFWVPTFVLGIDDGLLTDRQHPGSSVQIFGDPRPRILKTDRDVIDAMRWGCALSSFGDHTVALEGKKDQAIRLGRRVFRLSPDISAE